MYLVVIETKEPTEFEKSSYVQKKNKDYKENAGNGLNLSTYTKHIV